MAANPIAPRRDFLGKVMQDLFFWISGFEVLQNFVFQNKSRIKFWLLDFVKNIVPEVCVCVCPNQLETWKIQKGKKKMGFGKQSSTIENPTKASDPDRQFGK